MRKTHSRIGKRKFKLLFTIYDQCQYFRATTLLGGKHVVEAWVSFPVLLMIMLHLQFSCKSSFVFLSEFNCICHHLVYLLYDHWQRENNSKPTRKVPLIIWFLIQSDSTPIAPPNTLVAVLCSNTSESGTSLTVISVTLWDRMSTHTCMSNKDLFIYERSNLQPHRRQSPFSSEYWV